MKPAVRARLILGFVPALSGGCFSKPEPAASVAPDVGSSAETAAPSPTLDATPNLEAEVAAEPSKEVEHGTEVCLLCGAVHEVHRFANGDTRFEDTASEQHLWAVARIGACKEHAWQKTGCWFSSHGRVGSVSCSMFADEHMLWKALSQLDPAPATQLARRFAALARDQQLALWKKFNRDGGYPTRTEQGLARATAEQAGWLDLAAVWIE